MELKKYTKRILIENLPVDAQNLKEEYSKCKEVCDYLTKKEDKNLRRQNKLADISGFPYRQLTKNGKNSNDNNIVDALDKTIIGLLFSPVFLVSLPVTIPAFITKLVLKHKEFKLITKIATANGNLNKIKIAQKQNTEKTINKLITKDNIAEQKQNITEKIISEKEKVPQPITQTKDVDMEQ